MRRHGRRSVLGIVGVAMALLGCRVVRVMMCVVRTVVRVMMSVVSTVVRVMMSVVRTVVRVMMSVVRTVAVMRVLQIQGSGVPKGREPSCSLLRRCARALDRFLAAACISCCCVGIDEESEGTAVLATLGALIGLRVCSACMLTLNRLHLLRGANCAIASKDIDGRTCRPRQVKEAFG